MLGCELAKGATMHLPASARRANGTLEPMAPLTPEQVRRRERVESLIRLTAPGLNLVLAIGDRISRLVGSEDEEHYPPPSRAGAPEPVRSPPPEAASGTGV